MTSCLETSLISMIPLVPRKLTSLIISGKGIEAKWHLMHHEIFAMTETEKYDGRPKLAQSTICCRHSTIAERAIGAALN